MTLSYTKNFGLALPDFRSGPWHDLINNDFQKLDSILFSAMSQANAIPWTNSTHYTTGIAVLDGADSTIWMCVVDHTSSAIGTFAQDRSAHPTYWTRLLVGFAPRGEWARNINYFPYDLAYDSGRGIMALCTIKHTSTSTGSILDDKDYWVFLLDMSDVGLVTATAVTYSNTASGLAATDVQHAIDVVETQIKGLDNVNISQGNQITAIQNVNATQDNRLNNLETKTAFDTLTAPFFTATQNVSHQFGGSASVGYYMDASNAAIRPPGNGTVYFQSAGGAKTYGTIGNAGMNITGTLSANGAISGPNITVGSATVNGGGIYLSGWGGNGNISVIFLNSANNHYLYHDGTNVSFSGVSAIYAGNGRLWGSGDFGAPVSGIQWVYAGDTSTTNAGAGSMIEIGNAMITGHVSYWGAGYPIPVGFRHRYLQVIINNAWVTVGWAS